MVEYTLQLDSIFSSLSDPTRRDILKRVSRRQLSIGEIAKHYPLTFAAVSKHIKVLEEARLVSKKKQGKEHFVQLEPRALKSADHYLQFYRRSWDERFDRLDKYLKDM